MTRASVEGSLPDSLHVTLVTETYPPEINGVANTMRQMCLGLTENGYRVSLIRPSQGKHDRQVESAEGIRKIPTPGAPLPFYPGLQLGWPARRTVHTAFSESTPDLVYIATEGPLGASALRTARRLNLPVVAGFHTNFQAYSRHYGVGMLAPAVLAYMRRFHNRCRRTLVPTRQLADELTRKGFQNLKVWPRGVDTELFNPVRRNAKLRQKWKLDDRSLAVLYVGRIAPEKNIDLAVAAFNAIRQQRPDARFILVGSGPEVDRLLSEHPEFVFCGPRVGEDLAGHYASADLFLFPSTTETFGNVVTESMASGLATVAFKLAAAAEHLRNDLNGVVAAPGNEHEFIDQAVRIATDEDLRTRMATAARQDALGLGWPPVIQRLTQIFYETLRGASGGADHEPLAATTE